MDISVVIPVYNEKGNLAPLAAETSQVLEKTGKIYEIIFVNDGSTDASLAELKELNDPSGKIKIIDLNRNFGQTSAIMAGIDNSAGKVIITMDADRQNDPHDIPLLLEKLESGFDIVSGWRKTRRDPFLTRVLPSNTANWIISRVLKVRLHDYGCTLKAYKREALKDIRLYGEMHRFIPAIADWKGASITEVPVSHRKRTCGKSKYNLKRTVNVLLDLFLMVFLTEYRTKPIRFFGGLGICSGFMGLLSFITVVFMKAVKGANMTGNPLLILSVLFFLVSIQLMAMGFLGEINIRTYYESQDKKTYHVKEII
jgi:glycosyltransferase involved in cell wall biosynthesis